MLLEPTLPILLHFYKGFGRQIMLLGAHGSNDVLSRPGRARRPAQGPSMYFFRDPAGWGRVSIFFAGPAGWGRVSIFFRGAGRLGPC